MVTSLAQRYLNPWAHHNQKLEGERFNLGWKNPQSTLSFHKHTTLFCWRIWTWVFLGPSPKAIEIKTKINKWDQIKLTSFCTAKEIIKENKKTTYGMGDSICQRCDRQGLNFQNIQTAHDTQQQTNNPIEKWAEDLNRHFSKEEIQMANRYMKRCSTSMINREMRDFPGGTGLKTLSSQCRGPGFDPWSGN